MINADKALWYSQKLKHLAPLGDQTECMNNDSLIADMFPVSRGDADASFDQAWMWLCASRRNAPPDSDIWHLRYHWSTLRDRIFNAVLSGEYRLMPMLLTRKSSHLDRQVMWSAADALVLKWVALLVTPLLPLHPRCEHVKGHGGGRHSVHRMAEALKQQSGYAWVCRTDIRGYYRNINKNRLMAQVCEHVLSPVLRELIRQYIHYSVEDGGEFYTPSSGIARGCALSPLMGAVHLYAMDEWFSGQMRSGFDEKNNRIFYARYMDDIVILARTRWQLREQVRALNGFFNEGGFCQHPDKTFIGRTKRGFDWMGAQMYDTGVEDIAPRARLNHAERLRRLYERVRRWPVERRQARMSQYRNRWKMWAISVLLSCACYQAESHAASRPSTSAQCIFTAIEQGTLIKKPGTAGFVGTVPCTYDMSDWAPTVAPTMADASVSTITSVRGGINLRGSSDWRIQSAEYIGNLQLSFTATLWAGRCTLTLTDAGVPGVNPTTTNENSCSAKNMSTAYYDLMEDAVGAPYSGTMINAPKLSVIWAYDGNTDTIPYPSAQLHYDAVTGTSTAGRNCTADVNKCRIFSYGVGGSGNQPIPPPLLPAPPPTCSIVDSRPIADLGSTTPEPVPAQAPLHAGIEQSINLTCTSSSDGNRAATVDIVAWSAQSGLPGGSIPDQNLVLSDNTLVIPGASDGVVLKLKIVGSDNISLPSSNTSYGSVGSTSQTAAPWGSASVPARLDAGVFNANIKYIPEIWQILPIVVPGRRSYTVNYEMVMR